MFNWSKQLKILTRFVAPYALVLTITGCSSVNFNGDEVINIRPEAITPNFQSKLKVMTFNIALARRGNSDEIIAAIKSADPDVIGLQEVKFGHAAIIAKALDMNYAYGIHNDRTWGSNLSGTAVLSKFKILDSQKISIGGNGSNRSMVSAIALVNDQPIAFISIHTDHRLTDNRSLKRILNYTNSIEFPAVLIGDFNMVPSSPKSLFLAKESDFIDSAGFPMWGRLGTWAATGARIDYVFVQRKYFKASGASLVAPEYHRVSDHIAYYTTIEWK